MIGYERFKENIERKILEIIAEIEIAKYGNWYERLKNDIAVLKGVSEAIDKQISAEAIKLKCDVDTKIGNGIFKAGVTVYKCPCCYTFVTLSQKYCDQCGQALIFKK